MKEQLIMYGLGFISGVVVVLLVAVLNAASEKRKET